MRPWIAALRRAFPDLRASVEDVIADGDAVALRLTLIGTHEGEWLTQPPTGRRLAWSAVEVLHAGADGTFTEHWLWWDLVAPCQQVPAGGERRRLSTPTSPARQEESL